MASHLNLHLQQLAYLREVSRCPTLTAAAQRLHVSQPALSQSLAELERRLGVSLFERAGRQRRLTQEGREVADFARAVLASADELAANLDVHRRGDRGTLRIGMIDAASLYVLPPAVRAFRSAHPHVELRLTVASSTALLAALHAFDLDLAFVVGPVEADGVQTRPILREPLYVYAPPGARGAARAAEWALYPASSHTRALIDAGLRRLGWAPRVTLESGNPQVLRQMVALDIGWSVLPPAVAESGSQPLVRRRRQPIARRTLLAAWRTGSASDPRMAVFLALALQGIRAAPASPPPPGG